MRTSEKDTYGIRSTEQGARSKRIRDSRNINVCSVQCAECALNSQCIAQYIELNVGYSL